MAFCKQFPNPNEKRGQKLDPAMLFKPLSAGLFLPKLLASALGCE